MTCPDWSICPMSPAHSSCWTTGEGGSFRFCPKPGRSTHDQFELLFGTPPSSDVGEVARGFGLDGRDVASAAEFDEALARSASAASPGLIRVRLRSRAENVALHEVINQAVRLAST